MMAFGHAQDSSPVLKSEINMIPMIDIMLVLLLIFMLSIPLAIQQMAIQLPEVNATQFSPQAHTLSLRLDVQGQLWWNDEMLGYEEFKDRLIPLPKETPIQLAAADELPYRQVMLILGDLQRQGLLSIDLLTQAAH